MNTLPLAIDPIALRLGPINVTWYGMILGLGAVLGLLLAIREGKRFHLSPDFFMDLLLIGVPAAIIGARAYYVAFEWEHYKGDWYEIIAVWHGGLAIHGALIGAVLAGIVYTRVKKVNFWRIADIAAPSLIAGQMVGRWGNFINQEAHGGPVTREFLSDRLHLPDWIVNQMQIGDTYYHPTFLYESLWNFGVLLLLLWLRRRAWLKAGELFLGYFALYSLGRFFIEGLRTDSLAFHGPYGLEWLLAVLWSPMRLVFEAGDLPPGGGNVRMAQILSLLLIVTATLLIIVRRVGGFARERYLDPIAIGAAESAAGRAGGAGDGGTDGGKDGGKDGVTDGRAGGTGGAAGGGDGENGAPKRKKGPGFGWFTPRSKKTGKRDESHQDAGDGPAGPPGQAGTSGSGGQPGQSGPAGYGGQTGLTGHGGQARRTGHNGRPGQTGSGGHGGSGGQAGQIGQPGGQAGFGGFGVPGGQAGERGNGGAAGTPGQGFGGSAGGGPDGGPAGGERQQGGEGYAPPRYEPGNPLL